jgi:hypothetical protein
MGQNHHFSNELVVALNLFELSLHVIFGDELLIPLSTLDALKGEEHPSWPFLSKN